ncbi:MAG TPA: hypothetical protein VI775_01210 [Candidatus Paceibacterota bacterium]
MNEKRVVQDIVPGNKRTIRNLSIGMRKVNIDKRKPDILVTGDMSETPDTLDTSEIIEQESDIKKNDIVPSFEEIEYSQKSDKKKKRLWGTLITFAIIFVGVAIIAAATSLLYLKAVVSIIPKTTEININGTFTANKDAKFPDLPYEIIIDTNTMSQSIPASDGPTVETKAGGTVTIYNTQSSSQTLVAGTRLSNVPGIVYRTVSAIVIPASRSVGGIPTPGSISMKVIADQAGNEYNVELNNNILNIVAFKGGAKYDKVYAKMKTDISGGFKGNKKIIGADIEKATTDNIKELLKVDLMEKIKSSVTYDKVMFTDAYTIEYSPIDIIRKDANSADLSIKATIYGIVFKKDSFVKFIAEKDINKFPSSDYNISGLDDVDFTIINQKDFSPRDGGPVNFTVKGQITLTGEFNQEELKEELKGMKLSESSNIFSRYEAIDNAYSRITPFWMRSFPSVTKDIAIEIKH